MALHAFRNIKTMGIALAFAKAQTAICVMKSAQFGFDP